VLKRAFKIYHHNHNPATFTSFSANLRDVAIRFKDRGRQKNANVAVIDAKKFFAQLFLLSNSPRNA
jgi:hypothetical protein